MVVKKISLYSTSSNLTFPISSKQLYRLGFFLVKVIVTVHIIKTPISLLCLPSCSVFCFCYSYSFSHWLSFLCKHYNYSMLLWICQISYQSFSPNIQTHQIIYHLYLLPGPSSLPHAAFCSDCRVLFPRQRTEAFQELPLLLFSLGSFFSGPFALLSFLLNPSFCWTRNIHLLELLLLPLLLLDA